MDFSCPLISKSSSPFTNSLGIVPSAPTTIGITVTFMFHSFFSSIARSRYLSLFSSSFNFTLWSAGTARSTIQQVLLFFCWLSQGLFGWPKLGNPFASQNLREFRMSDPLRQIPCCACTTCLYGRISISCTIPGGSLFLPYCIPYEFFTPALADGLSL